jgi:histidine phosphotransferase ChpT
MTSEREAYEFDMRLAELLVSRLCHDLASPVGAVMSGLELMEEFEGDTAGDALRLMGDSARIAARRLAFYRLTFGAAGNAEGVSVGEARNITADFMAGGRTELDWPVGAEAARLQTAEGGLKLLLAVVFVALECLPRGGKLRIGLEPGEPGRFQIEACGTAARIAERAAVVLDGSSIDPARLDSANAPACYAGSVARRMAVALQVTSGPDRVSFALRLPLTS